MDRFERSFLNARQHLQAGELAAAERLYREILTEVPTHPGVWHNLGVIALQTNRLDEAAECLREAVRLRPQYPASQFYLGTAFMQRGEMNDAAACFREALRLQPDDAMTLNNLGYVHGQLGRLDEAMEFLQQALALRQDVGAVHSNLGNVRKDQGRIADSLTCYRSAIHAATAYPKAFHNLLFALWYDPSQDGAAILREHRAWAEQFAEPLRDSIPSHSNDRSPSRRLRIGYVSSELSFHVLGQNLLPLLREHDREQVEVFCYSSVERPDEMTGRLRSHADGWRDILPLNDEQVAELVREDGIDILVDLALHSGHSRLLMFARKPAPVQVTYLGYPGTTGLSAIDYRFTDQYLDPHGFDEALYSETSVRLRDSFYLYEPRRTVPDVQPLPCLKDADITFGCLNTFCKVNEGMLRLWAKVLHRVPNSRLIVHCPEGSHRQWVRDVLESEGMNSRVELVGRLPYEDYMRLYGRIDINLDTLPFNGGITSLDGFYMGVPVITLVGRTVVGRAGVSLLMNLGLQELIARSPEEYVEIAAGLASDQTRLVELRANLRERMRASPLMDAPRFARSVEAVYQAMWQRWCASTH